MGDTAKKSTLRGRQTTAHQNRTNSFAMDAVASCSGSEFKRASKLDAQGGIGIGARTQNAGPVATWENDLMSGPRYDRILASTALALILAAPLGSAATAQEAAESAAQRAAAKFAAAGLDAAIKPQPADGSPAATPASPAVATEQTAAPDPMASLDPADRAIAEKIRDLLATKADKIFASKKE